MSRLTLLPLVLILSSCNLGFDDGFGDDDDIDDLPRTLESVRNEIFDPYCVRCHGEEDPDYGLRLDTEEFIRDIYRLQLESKDKEDAILIVPGDPYSSYLVDKVEGYGNIEGSRMPPSGAKLSDSRIKLLRDWIANLSTETGAESDVSAANISRTKVMATATDTITFNLHFSRPIDAESLTLDSILVQAKIDDEYQWLTPEEHYELYQVDNQNADIDIKLGDLDATAIRLRVNDPSVAAVAGENGLLLDGDNDDSPGGAFEYIYEIPDLQ